MFAGFGSQAVLSADKGKAFAEFQQKIMQFVDKGLLKSAFPKIRRVLQS